MSLVDASRYTWRAELNEYSAAELKESDPDKAAVHEKSAAYQRQYADLMTELADAKVLGDNEYLRDVKLRVINFRRIGRQGAYPLPGVLDNFEEPSNLELTGE